MTRRNWRRCDAADRATWTSDRLASYALLVAKVLVLYNPFLVLKASQKDLFDDCYLHIIYTRFKRKILYRSFIIRYTIIYSLNLTVRQTTRAHCTCLFCSCINFVGDTKYPNVNGVFICTTFIFRNYGQCWYILGWYKRYKPEFSDSDIVFRIGVNTIVGTDKATIWNSL